MRRSILFTAALFSSCSNPRHRRQPTHRARTTPAHVLGHPPHPLGGGRLQDPRRVPGHGPAEHPQGDAAAQGAARVTGSCSTRWPTSGRSSSGIPSRRPTSAGSSAEGRLQLAGALDVMPDDNMPGRRDVRPADAVRQGVLPREARRGRDDRLAARHLRPHAQMPQLLTLGGLQVVLVLPRRAPAGSPSEFLWEGIDGTRIPAFWLPYSYGLLYHSPKRPARVPTRSCAQRFDDAGRRTPWGSDRVGLAGADVSEPEEHLVPMVKAFNEQKDAPRSQLRLARARRLRGRRRQADRPARLQGRAEPDLPGDYSSRIELKEWMRTIERKLAHGGEARRHRRLAGCSGRLAATLARLGAGALQRDARPGLGRHDRPRLRGHDPQLRVLRSPGRRADRRGLGRPRREDRHPRCRRRPSSSSTRWAGPARTSPRWTSASTERGVKSASPWSTRPGQTSRPDRSRRPVTPTAGSRRRAIAFVARDVPALGYRVYHVVPGHRGAGDEPDAAGETGNVLENDLYRVASTSRPARSRAPGQGRRLGGPLRARQRRGRAAGPGRPLGALSRPRRRQPDRDDDASGPDPRQGPAVQRRGQGQARHVSAAGRSISEFRGRAPVRLRQVRDDRPGLPRPAADRGQTRLVNNEKYVRYQALFPTTITGGKNVHEIPFGAIERPAAIEFPAQNWVDHGDGRTAWRCSTSACPATSRPAGR